MSSKSQLLKLIYMQKNITNLLIQYVQIQKIYIKILYENKNSYNIVHTKSEKKRINFEENIGKRYPNIKFSNKILEKILKI